MRITKHTPVYQVKMKPNKDDACLEIMTVLRCVNDEDAGKQAKEEARKQSATVISIERI